MEAALTEEIIARQPPEAQAVIRLLLARGAKLEAENGALRALAADLQAKLQQLQRQAKAKSP